MTAGAPAVLDAVGVRRRLGQGGDVFEVVIEELSLAPASRIAVVGPSGCGKSTALALLALALRPDEARRFLFMPPAGKPIDAQALWRDGRHDRLAGARARMLGFVPQVGGLLPFLSLRANIALPQSMLGRIDNARVADLAERLEIAAVLDRLPAQVSVGQRQRAAVARALAHEPALVLADEPTASVHPAQADVVMGLLAAFARRTGAALIVATHDRHLADAAGLMPAPMRPAAGGRRGVLAWAA